MSAEFEAWWKAKANGIRPLPTDDLEEYAKWIARAAWHAARQWRPIDEAPKDGTRVMLWRGPGLGVRADMVIAEWHDGEWCWPDQGLYGTPSTHGEWTREYLDNGYSTASDFTHWQPLPEPPK